MSRLIEQIKQKDACAFTHGGKFHADDVFSSALLLYINPEISITRGNSVPDDFTGIVFDIGRGEFDHHQKDSRIRENGVPYAAFGLLWEAVGADILGEELAVKFDESFVQPLDNNDNTGEKNELATLIGNFNPSWDYEGGSDEAFFQAVSVAGMILENKFERYRGNERADKRVEEVLAKHDPASRILVLPEFIPCQKALSETDIAFVIFPSNRGGFCIQPQKREYSMNYKCSFPAEWLGLEGEELVNATGSKRFEIEELKKMLGLIDKKGNEQFVEITAFRSKVLEIAKKQINENTDIEIDFELKKRGRSFHWITLHINSQKFKQLEIEFDKSIDIQKFKSKLMAYGFNEEQAELIATQEKEKDFDILITELNEKVRSRKLAVNKSIAYLVGIYQKKGILIEKN